jgi:hypothetical protein
MTITLGDGIGMLKITHAELRADLGMTEAEIVEHLGHIEEHGLMVDPGDDLLLVNKSGRPMPILTDDEKKLMRAMFKDADT